MKSPADKINLQNLLLISSSGRNCGKTLLACQIITKLRETHCIVAIKISMHNHEPNQGIELLEMRAGHQIWQDKSTSHKDSGRYLAAGAHMSLYIETTDSHLENAFLSALKYLPPESMIICECGPLIHHVQPAMFIFVEKNEDSLPNTKLIYRSQATLILNSDKVLNGDISHRIVIHENRWIKK